MSKLHEITNQQHVYMYGGTGVTVTRKILSTGPVQTIEFLDGSSSLLNACISVEEDEMSEDGHVAILEDLRITLKPQDAEALVAMLLSDPEVRALHNKRGKK